MTIKIYEAGGGENSIEFFNVGYMEENQMALRIDHDEHDECLYFNLSYEDAISLVKYLASEFGFSLKTI